MLHALIDACKQGAYPGPVISGYLAQEAGWRWIFWLLAISSGVLTVSTAAILHETYAPVILKHQSRTAKKNSTAHSPRKPDPFQVFLRAILRPTKLLFLSPVAAIVALLISIYYSYLYFLFTTFTPVFEEQYRFSTGAAGLAFLGIGIGLLLGVVLVGLFVKKYTERKRLQVDAGITPEDRLPPVGWTAHFRVHWIVPMIGTLFVGFGAALAFLPVQMYLVDAFQLYAASAVATNTILRNIIGATLPLAGGKLYGSLGLGWGNTVLGLICVAIIPVPILLLPYGNYLRTNTRFQVRLD
ncbi:MFS general substrate transporter [Periconia macrospinosa]|uniref:MFS general substrate transporter n=1 Tax=Periconia macrospinosa TaxID=97972 RepID=A0A2V1D4I4_9PLEO|nr:MFS general substrate transporter [Periconia macrospinosa]